MRATRQWEMSMFFVKRELLTTPTMSSGSSGNSVTAPEPSWSILFLMRRIIRRKVSKDRFDDVKSTQNVKMQDPLP